MHDDQEKLFSFLLLLILQHIHAQPVFHPEEMVNVLMGTDSKVSFSNGNTYPAIALPWGMNFGLHRQVPMPMDGSTNIEQIGLEDSSKPINRHPGLVITGSSL